MHYILLIVLPLLAVSSYACREVDWSPSEWAENSQAAYIGEIVTASPVHETESAQSEFARAAIAASRTDRVLVIRVAETLKGKPIKSLNIILSGCGGGSGDVADNVVAFQLGDYWHIKNSNPAITAAKAALTNRSKATLNLHHFNGQ